MSILPASPPSSGIGSICLFCGSSNQAAEDHLEAAADFGRTLAAAGVRLVYGGGGVGLMGEAARAAHSAGGSVLGVIPEFLQVREVRYDAVETVVVPNMHERKRIMFEQSDAFAVFPGGIGTLEEAIEILSWRRLGLHDKPVVFFNLGGFWEPLFALLHHTVDQGLSPGWLGKTWGVADRVEDVLSVAQRLKSASPEVDAAIAARV